MEILLTEQKIAKILERGLDINGYISLALLKSGSELKIDGFTTTGLTVLGYLHTDFKTLTIKGNKLLEELEGKSKPIKELALQDMYYRILEEFVRLTGKKQIVIDGKYSFLCNAVDFEEKLNRVIKKYKLLDVNKIEKVLINYINRAKRANFVKMTLLKYYIEKNGESILATDYSNFDEKEMKRENEVIDNSVNI